MKIVIIGAGNLATHLALALQNAGEEIIQIFSRTEISAKELADKIKADFTTDFNNIYSEAELYIYAVSDSALTDLIKNNIAPEAIHIHTAGSVPMQIFESVKSKFGVVYPLQTFSKNKEINFRDVPVFIEASSPEIQKNLFKLASEISDHVFEVNSQSRLQLHIAAVFACNFVNFLYGVSKDILNQSELPFEVLIPLICETADKINYLSPEEAQTGPAKRNDMQVMDKHLLMLENQPELKELYRNLSQMIFKKYLHQS
jgi:predicted short-subunit dehydrogenase-like oxidoreductase (DUF2520 family)